MVSVQLNGLALKYEREYGTARRYVDIANVRDYPITGRIGRVFGPGFFEQVVDVDLIEGSTFDHDVGNPEIKPAYVSKMLTILRHYQTEIIEFLERNSS